MSLSKQRCDVCDLSFTSYQHYSIHLGGLLHDQKKRRKLEGEGPARFTDSKMPASFRYAGPNVDSVSTSLHSCLKQLKSSVMSLPCDAGLAPSSQRSHHSDVTVASSQATSLRSDHLSSEFSSPNDAYYRDNRQLDNKETHGWESHRGEDLNRRERENQPHANNTKETLAKTSSSVVYGSKEKSAILALLAAQRLLQDKPLEEKSPKKQKKVEVNSRDSARSLLSAQFDLLKSYMTEPQKPTSARASEEVEASRGQDLQRQKATDWSGAGRSTMAGSTRILPSRHSLEAADRYSAKDQSMGQRPQGSVKTPDFWSRQATYTSELPSDLSSSIPFLGEGCATDEGMLDEPPDSFLPHSLDQVSVSAWDRKDDGFNAGQWNRPTDHAVKTTLADVSKASGLQRSAASFLPHSHDEVAGSAWDRKDDSFNTGQWSRPPDRAVKTTLAEVSKGPGLQRSAADFLPHLHDEVAASVWDKKDDSFNAGQWNRPPDHVVKTTPADVSKGSGLQRSAAPSGNRTWQGHGHNTVKSGVPSEAWELREDNGMGRTADRTYDDKRQFVSNEDHYSSDLSNPLFSSENSRKRPAVGNYQHQMPSFRDDYRIPVPPLMEPKRSQSSMEEFMAQVKENLRRDLKYDSSPAKTSGSEVRTDFGRSYPVTAPLQPPSTHRKVLLSTPSTSEPLGTSFNVSTTSAVAKRKILLPTPIADPTTAQSSLTSISATATARPQLDGRGGIGSRQQPRFGSPTPGGGRFSCSGSSTATQPPMKKTLLSTPPASCLQPRSYGNSSSSAGVLSLVKQLPLPAALPAKSSPLSRSLGVDKNLVPAGACSKTLPSLPVKTTLKTTTAAANPPPSSGKLEVTSSAGNSVSGEVDPHSRLQKEIEVVMAERVEDLMRAIPDSMMQSIMDGKVPLEFLDKISDLIPTEVIEEAVKQKELSAADRCASAGGGPLRKGTSRMPLAGHQIAKPEATVAMELNSGGEVELVKKMIDEILGDLASETVAPANTDILENLAPDDRRMVLEMQEVAGIRDVSVTIEVLEFFKNLDRNLLLTLSTMNEAEKDGESVLKRMTKLMLNNFSRNDLYKSTVAGVVSKNTPTFNSSQTKTSVVASEKQTAKWSPYVSRQKVENPEIKATLISASETPPNTPRSTTIVVEKLGVDPQKDSVSATSGVVSVSNVPQTVTASTGKPGNKTYFLQYHNNSTGPGKTSTCVPHTKPVVVGSSFSSAAKVDVSSVKSELIRISFNRQNEAKTKTVPSTQLNPTIRNEPSKVPGSAAPVEKNPTVRLAVDSKDSTVSQNQKAGIVVAGKTALPVTSGSCLTNRSGNLKTPEAGGSSAVNMQITSSDKFGLGGSSDAAPCRTEMPKSNVPGSNAPNHISDKVSTATVTTGVQQAKAAVTTPTATLAAAASAMGTATSSVVAKQGSSNLTDKTDCHKLPAMEAKSVGQSVRPLDPESAQPCAVDVKPADQLSSDKAEKRKATEEPLEQSKKLKLGTIVSEKPAATISASTAPPKTSHAATARTGNRCLLATPTQIPPRGQSTKPKTPLLPTPLQSSTRPVSLQSPHSGAWNRPPLLQAPFPPQRPPLSQAPYPPQRPLLPRAIEPNFPPSLLRQEGPPSVPNVRPLMPAHRMSQSSPRESFHPPEQSPLNLLPRMMPQVPPSPPRMGMWPQNEPFRSRNSVNFRPCLPNPSPNRCPLMHAGDYFRFRGPDSDSFGRPPFNRWR